MKHITYSINHYKRSLRPFELIFHNISTGKSWPGSFYSTRKKALELCDNRFNFLQSKSWSFRKFSEFDADSDLGFFCDGCGDYDYTSRINEHNNGATWLCDNCNDNLQHNQEDEDEFDCTAVDQAVFDSQEQRHKEKS
jgi:hypothetical protein